MSDLSLCSGQPVVREMANSIGCTNYTYAILYKSRECHSKSSVIFCRHQYVAERPLLQA